MRKFFIERQNSIDERVFTLRDLETGDKYEVDIYTDGKLGEFPQGASDTAESWRAWLGTFVGGTIEVERISPYLYFTGGETKVTPPLTT